VQVEELRAEQNRAGKAIGKAQGEDKQRLIAEVGEVSMRLKALEPELEQVDGELNDLLARTPNVPHESSPGGFHGRGRRRDPARGRAPRRSTSSRAITPRSGSSWASWTPIAAPRTSGSRFVYLLGDIVHVQFALVRHALDALVPVTSCR
jgi:seryl-tRNA synthetase